MPSQLITFLHNSGLVSLTSAGQIAGQFRPRQIAKGEYVLKAGQMSNEYIFMERGFLRAFAYDVEGNDITTAFYTGNEVMFEVSSYFSRTQFKENIQALTDCSGWFVTYPEFNALFHSMPEFREFGRSVLVKGYAALKNRTLGMITETAEERYATLLKTNPEILQNAPLKTIATYLGITDTSLSRIRKEFAHRQV